VVAICPLFEEGRLSARTDPVKVARVRHRAAMRILLDEQKVRSSSRLNSPSCLGSRRGTSRFSIATGESLIKCY
jgi:hypothetical protein